MTVLRFHCPGCESACQVSDAAAMSGTRCDHCGLILVPNIAIRSETVSGGTRRRCSLDEHRRFRYHHRLSIPPPRSLAPLLRPLRGRTGHKRRTTARSALGTSPDAARDGGADAAREGGPDAAREDGPDATPGFESDVAPTVSTVGSETALGANAGRPDPAIDRSAIVVGPPPPYRTITPPTRPAPSRPEMAPAPAAPPVNMRGIGALGPPPPYRPIVQASLVFERGPAPDLEPWRLASLTHALPDREAGADAVPVSTRSPETDWTISRDPEPNIQKTSSPLDEARLEVDDRADPFARPEVRPARPPLRPRPYGPRGPLQHAGGRSTGRAKRPVVWAAGIAVAAAVAGMGGGAVFRTWQSGARESRER